jgi:phosphatidylinositol alpha 1,6-mannosyltransferase
MIGSGGAGGGRLRVAVVTESFLPSLNGVTTSVCRVLEHLGRRGHEAAVICPGPAPREHAGFPVVQVPAFRYREFPVGLPTPVLQQTLADFAPDVVHVASPFVLGAAGLTAARRLGVPSVAIFQTDVAGFARTHRLGLAAPTAWRWIRRIHDRADLTLAPSTPALADLRAHGVPRLGLWGRGVDAERFRPQRRATDAVDALRARLAPGGEVLVGYVGRLAPEKRVERLAAVAGLPGVRLVVVGDGPARAATARALPGATFLGRLDGEELADAYAALDVFVHTGTEETFGQTIQEAMASGVPVVAPAAGGPLDLLAPGVEGLLYAPEDDDDLRDAVAGLVTDAERRAVLGAAGRGRVLPRSWAALGDQLLGHYAGVIAERALATAA